MKKDIEIDRARRAIEVSARRDRELKSVKCLLELILESKKSVVDNNDPCTLGRKVGFTKVSLLASVHVD